MPGIAQVDGVTAGGSGGDMSATLSAVHPGDLVVACVFWDNPGAMISPSAGWGKLDALNMSPTGQVAWYSRVVAVAEPPSYHFLAAPAVGWRLMYLAFRNAKSAVGAGNNASPATPSEFMAGNAYQLPQVTTSGANEVILHMGVLPTDPGFITWASPGLSQAGFGSGIAAFYEAAPVPGVNAATLITPSQP
jgi:hypothetical protein